MPGPHQVAAGILAGPHQIPGGLLLHARHDHLGELVDHQQPG
jgi:hypothetical protein